MLKEPEKLSRKRYIKMNSIAKLYFTAIVFFIAYALLCIKLFGFSADTKAGAQKRINDLHQSVLIAKSLKTGPDQPMPLELLEKIQTDAEKLNSFVINRTTVHVDLAAGTTTLSFIVALMGFFQQYRSLQHDKLYHSGKPNV